MQGLNTEAKTYETVLTMKNKEDNYPVGPNGFPGITRR